MAIHFLDKFTEVSTVALESHTSDSGHTWTGPSYFSVDTVGVWGNNTTDGLSTSSYTPSTTTYSIKFEVNLQAGISSLSSNIACMFCYTDANNWYWVRFTRTGLDIYEKVVGATSALHTTTSYASSGTYVVRIDVTPTKFDVYVDDILEFTHTSNALSRTTPLALYSNDTDQGGGKRRGTYLGLADTYADFINQKPVITRLGDAVVNVPINTTYVDAGATASDPEDGDITGSIVTYNPVNTAILGTYVVTYNVVDSEGLAADAVSRTVNVVDTGRRVLSFDGDNIVSAGQSATISVRDLDASPVTQSVTLSGQALTIDNWVGGAGVSTIDVTIPANIPLAWGSTDNELVVTDDTGSESLSNVRLEAESGWEYVYFNGEIPNPATTESFYELAQTDLSLVMVLGDVLAFQSSNGLTVDSYTVPTISGTYAQGNYKVWDASAGAWTAEAAYSFAENTLLDSTTSAVEPTTNRAYVTITSLAPVEERLTSLPTLDINDQVAYDTRLFDSLGTTPTVYTVTINADGTYTLGGGPIPNGDYVIKDLSQWDSGTTTWGALVNEAVSGFGGASIPATSRTSIFQIANYLRSLGTYNSSQCNELVVEWLVSEGITRTQINQMLYGYLGGLGYTGSFNDRLKAWSEDV